ncbi:MAG: hydrogenase formation protein HypD [Actinomycetia bacterium]|nr:hydrogenase formation protein HypD [Actinomycetes bacterium]
MLSGPGCPVCVTANADIDRIIALTNLSEVTVATFGDMLRVPGSSSSLAERRATGAAVSVVYSPLDALRLAEQQPERQIVFIGVGFETTAPIIAASLVRARAEHRRNFSVLTALKLVPPALRALLEDPALRLDGLILPGHVSTILGLEPYRFIAENYQMPAVITGFEPLDILMGVYQLLLQLEVRATGARLAVGNAYARAVPAEGNPVARARLAEVFQTTDAIWRGLGPIPASGLVCRPEFAEFDASQKWELTVEPTVETPGCRCGEVLRGVLLPPQCPHFGRSCTPLHPLGPCMVSSEGSCAAYYKYGIGGTEDQLDDAWFAGSGDLCQ